MKPRAMTLIFIVAFVVIAIAYDVYAYLEGGTEATISWIIYEASHEIPFIPFLFGLLCGHFFTQMKGTVKIKESKS